MPRKRRPDQGPPIPRIRNACVRCKEKRFKCSEIRPCSQCAEAEVVCIAQNVHKRRRQDRNSIFEHVVEDLEGHAADEGPNQPDYSDVVELVRTDFDASSPSGTTLESIFDQTSRCLLEELDGYSPLKISSSTSTGIDIGISEEEASLEVCSLPTRTRSTTAIMNSFLEEPIFLTRPSTPVTSSLLDLNPLYRELWYHYTEVLSCLHTPHDPSSNPIIKVLSPAALSHDPLLAVLLASSLENYRSLRGLEPDEVLLKTLINTALLGVQQELSCANTAPISDNTLATVVALCDYEIVARKRATTSSWRIHLEGAKKIINLRGGPGQNATSSDFFQFLLKWLAYFDIMSSITNTETNSELLFEGNYWLKQDKNGKVIEEDSKLDPYMGFLQNVVPYFRDVGKLVLEKQRLQKCLNLRKAQDLHVRCKALEARLKDTLGIIPGHNWMRPAKLSILIDCHDAFVYSTMIHLYRRVEGLSSDSTEVRTAVTLGLQHIQSSCQSSPSEIDSSLLFPLFTFGCEAGSQDEQEYIFDRLRVLGALGLGNVDRAIEVLTSMWSENESTNYTRQPEWNQILRMFDWDPNLA